MAGVSLVNSGPSADEAQQQTLEARRQTDDMRLPPWGPAEVQSLALTQRSPISAKQVSPPSRHWAQTLTLPTFSHAPALEQV